MNLIIPKDCDNAPKKKIIAEFIRYFYMNDSDKLEELLTEGFIFHRVGIGIIDSISDLKNYSSAVKNPEEVEIISLITHGKLAACDLILKNSNQIYQIAYIFKFQSAAKNYISRISEYKILYH